MKVAIVVICYVDKGEHEMLAETSKQTMGLTATDDVKIWYVWGQGRTKADTNDFITSHHEDRGAVLKKTLAFLQHYQYEDFDYILRINDGSYIDIPNMLAFLKDKPKEKFYCGIPGNVVNIDFASGSGFFLSRDLVKLMMEHIYEFGEHLISDVAIGEFMMKHNVPIDLRANRMIIHYDGGTRQIGNEVFRIEDFDHSKIYHYYCRSGDGDRWVDCEHMKRLYHELNNK